ncbi:MAG TPA: hypothetical protein VEA44_18055 [Caulobacter sp.]|nr:hypothetical protein [Caulobacter sp.]
MTFGRQRPIGGVDRLVVHWGFAAPSYPATGMPPSPPTPDISEPTL